MCTGDLVGGGVWQECLASDCEIAPDRCVDGGVCRPVDGRGLCDAGVHTSMSTSGVCGTSLSNLPPPAGGAWGGGSLLRAVVSHDAPPVACRGGGCHTASCRSGRGVPWSPTLSASIHRAQASRSDSGSDCGSLSGISRKALDAVTYPRRSSERRWPMSAIKSALLLRCTPMWKGTCSHCREGLGASTSPSSCCQRST